MSNGQPSPSTARELRSAGSTQVTPLSAQAIFNEIVRKIHAVKDFTELVYESVPPKEGALICRSLAESNVVESSNARVNFNSFTRTLWVRIMSTELQDVHQRWFGHATSTWVFDGLINQSETKLLDMGVGTTFHGFTGQYTQSSKEPDLYLRPDTTPMPRIIVESGWSESWPRLHADKDLWLNGSTDPSLVILLKWSKLSHDRAKGTMEIWRRNPAGGLAFCEKAIFPAPVSAPAPGVELVQFTKVDLFGQHMVSRQKPNAVLSLNLSDLRDFARERMAQMGLTPA